MPRATINLQSTKRFELKSCPEGFVVLRKMSYGQFLHRRDIAAKMRMSAKDENADVQTELMQRKVSEYEFSVCIVEHNLEDETGRTLDFNRTKDFDSLDPLIGQEIDSYIESMNRGGLDNNVFPESEQA